MDKLKYLYSDIFLKEIPDEISLGFAITGCTIKCPKCHSKHTWDKYKGKTLDKYTVLNRIKSQKGVSCILFFGGEDRKDLINIIQEIKDNYDLKIAMYSGRELNFFLDRDLINLFKLDYLKVGPYIEELGALNTPITNQILYKIVKGKLENITHKFWRNNA